VANSKLLNRKDLLAYFLVAGTGALVQIIVGSLCRDFMGYAESVAVGYLVSFVVGFTLTKLFAFDARRTNQTRREMVKFGMVAVLSFVITVGAANLSLKAINALVGETMHLRFRWPFLSDKRPVTDINVNEFGSLLIAMGLSFATNYVLHKTFTFKSTGFYDRIKAYIR
jgi:putative flippase GtrA